MSITISATSTPAVDCQNVLKRPSIAFVIGRLSAMLDALHKNGIRFIGSKYTKYKQKFKVTQKGWNNKLFFNEFRHWDYIIKSIMFTLRIWY